MQQSGRAAAGFTLNTAGSRHCQVRGCHTDAAHANFVTCRRQLLHLPGSISESRTPCPQNICSTHALTCCSPLSCIRSVAAYSLTTHTQGCCLLVGAAGLGVDVLEQRTVMSGSSWAPSACCERGSPFLYRAVHAAEDVDTLPEVRS
jgi:hypothetical protein